MIIKLHTTLLILAALYIVGFDTYCGVSGDARCNGPAVTEADASVDAGELSDIGPDDEIEAYDVEESDLPARTQDLARRLPRSESARLVRSRATS